MNTSTSTTTGQVLARFAIGPEQLEDGIGSIVIVEHPTGVCRFEVFASHGDQFGKFAKLSDAFACAAKVVAALTDEFVDFWGAE